MEVLAACLSRSSCVIFNKIIAAIAQSSTPVWAT